MFWNKKEIKCESETESRGLSLTEEIDLYRRIVEELENGYLPIREKCIEVIMSHGLNRYPLSDVIELRRDGNDAIIKIYDLKEDWWDGNKTLKKDTILLEERFRFEAAQELDHTSLMYAVIVQSIEQLRDETDYVRGYLALLVSKLTK